MKVMPDFARRLVADRPASTPGWRSWLRYTMNVVILCASAYFVVRTMAGQFRELTTVASVIEPLLYPALVALAMLSMVITALLHGEVLRNVASGPMSMTRVCYAYALSQLARYVPGKLFGVILEAQLLSPAVTIKEIVVATIAQTGIVYVWVGALTIGILGGVRAHSPWPVAALPLMLAVVWLAHRNRWYARMADRLTVGKREVRPSRDIDERARRRAPWIVVLLLSQWLPFVAVWALLAGPEQSSTTVMWLTASYLLASIGGSLLVLIPSGLVVREAAFMWLGVMQGIPGPTLLTWALVVRIVLTLADVLVVPPLWLLSYRRSST